MPWVPAILHAGNLLRMDMVANVLATDWPKFRGRNTWYTLVAGQWRLECQDPCLYAMFCFRRAWFMWTKPVPIKCPPPLLPRGSSLSDLLRVAVAPTFVRKLWGLVTGVSLGGLLLLGLLAPVPACRGTFSSCMPSRLRVTMEVAKPYQ